MKKAVAALALVAAGSLGLTGCYLSREVAGNDMVGGPVNPLLWVTVPIDTVLFPFEIAHYCDKNDPWVPWSADQERWEYDGMYKASGPK